VKSYSLALFSVCALVCRPLPAQVKLDAGSTITFATLEEGRAILTNRDDFVQRMSPFDRASRLKTDRDVSEAEYLKFVAQNVLAWDDAGKAKVEAAIRGIQPGIESLNLPFPGTVQMIETTGKEEGGAEYTRSNAIVLPQPEIASASSAKLQKIIAHELFHVLSRANPELRDKLYEAIGFVKCNEVEFPAELKPRKLTNPDAPKNDHCVRLQVAGRECWAIPILFSNTEKYDVARGGEFFNYLEFKLLLVDRNADSGMVTPIYDGQKARLVSLEQVSGFFEQVGRNTQYVIHPEEILADNFSLLVLQKHDLPSPEITRKMEAILKNRP
jgi:hypothetical protein